MTSRSFSEVDSRIKSLEDEVNRLKKVVSSKSVTEDDVQKLIAERLQVLGSTAVSIGPTTAKINLPQVWTAEQEFRNGIIADLITLLQLRLFNGVQYDTLKLETVDNLILRDKNGAILFEWRGPSPGTMVIYGDLIPDSNNARDFGVAGNEFRYGKFQKISVANAGADPMVAGDFGTGSIKSGDINGSGIGLFEGDITSNSGKITAAGAINTLTKFQIGGTDGIDKTVKGVNVVSTATLQYKDWAGANQSQTIVTGVSTTNAVFEKGIITS